MTDLEFSDLSVRIGERVLLDGVTLRIRAGEFVALIGPNGAGKSTLLKTALALRAPSSGSVRLAQCSVAALDARRRAELIAWLPQHIRADEPVTGLESVAAARYRFRESHALSRRAAERALARVGAREYAERRVTELSGGERQRIAFACLIAQEAEILVFDEPANHLDPAQQLDVYRLLGELWREGRSILCINHDVNLLHQVGEAARVRVVGLRAGRLVFDAPLDAATLPEQIGNLFGVEMDSLQGSEQRFIVARSRRTS
ncbi:MAG TPA: ABC transporter ATP-binding protein [Polyangiaceae bacterium]|nr:ABC transporter ATP-binding protein [Polyangiaceae bacterium]HYQ28264.1 ABC transporter ATP-binding protein [Polyangiaceae bacterium]